MPQVAILLGTFNGSRYLAEQLASYAQQTVVDWQLWASDDGSQDDTLHILRAFQAQQENNKVQILQGPQQGLGRNFLSLLAHPSIHARYYAFSDQDDIWHPNKLERAIEHLDKIPTTQPALYFSQHWIIDAQGKRLGRPMPSHHRPLTFQNALIQSLPPGHSLVLNQAARDLILQAGVLDVPYHDWWCYLLISGTDGRMIFDPTPTLDYRQHDANMIGTNAFLKSKWTRLLRLANGQFLRTLQANLHALQKARDLLTPTNQRTLDNFQRAFSEPCPQALRLIWQSGIYRQNPLEMLTLTFLIACLKLNPARDKHMQHLPGEGPKRDRRLSNSTSPSGPGREDGGEG